jgi:hypothetical protein
VPLSDIAYNSNPKTAPMSTLQSQALPHDNECPDRGQPGYLGEIKLHFGQALVVTTEVGMAVVGHAYYIYKIGF